MQGGQSWTLEPLNEMWEASAADTVTGLGALDKAFLCKRKRFTTGDNDMIQHLYIHLAEQLLQGSSEGPVGFAGL